MASMKALLAGAALSVLTIATAQAQNVEWKDDGTVLLKLGPDYDNAVITAAQGRLGAVFGPGKKPFEGVTITVLTLDPAPRAASPARSTPSGRSGRSCPAASSTSSSCRSPSTTPR